MNRSETSMRTGVRAAVFGLSGFVAAAALLSVPWGFARSSTVKVQMDATPVAREAGVFAGYAPVVKRVSPSVVKVYVSARPRMTSGPGMDLRDLRRFFGGGEDGFPGMPPGGRMPREEGVGSGVVVTEDGYILTNNHVVESADGIRVAFQDGREFDAKVVGRDPQTDIAVVRIEAKDLPAITMADSDAIEVGDVVLAVGNPFGIGQTVTTGIVSAKGRATLGLDYEDFIQTDAAINPGNSGGALVDVQGRLVGINTAILSRSGGNQGIGFAVPSNLARWVMEGLVENGRVDRGFLGVNIQDLTGALAAEFKVDAGKGALVAEVTPRTPADKAGLKSGDVVLEFNGKEIRDSRQLKLQVGSTKPGTTVPLKILRDGSSRLVRVTLAELPGQRLAKRAPSAESDQSSEALAGVVVGDLQAGAREQMQAPTQLRGAVVTGVDEDSAAYRAGLRPGDIITEINRKPVANAEEAVAACENAKDRRTLVRVWSRGGSRYVLVDESANG